MFTNARAGTVDVLLREGECSQMEVRISFASETSSEMETYDYDSQQIIQNTILDGAHCSIMPFGFDARRPNFCIKGSNKNIGREGL